MAKNKPNKWQSRIVGHDKVRADQLLANPRNHRRHPQKQREVVAASIEELGFCKSVIVNQRTGYIVDGHERVMQALGAGDDTLVDVEYVDLSEEDERKLLLILDASSELAEVDACDLEELLRTVNTSSQELADWFTELGEAAKIFDPETESDGDSDLDSVPEDAEPVCKVGDLWILGEHRLLCGDSSDQQQVDRLLAGAKIDCVLTDPPYGINYDAETSTQQGIQKFRKLHGDHLPFDASRWIGYKDVFAWCLPQHTINLPTGAGCWYAWDKVTQNDLKVRIGEVEFAWHKNATKTRMFRHLWSGAYRASESGEKSRHPTQKPVAVMMWCLEIIDEAKAILDPFCGSGTTLIACEKAKRICYAVEFEPKYCDVIIDRWEKLTGRKAVKA